jgi:carbon storage regulator
MLVLSRRPGDAILIDGGIRIVVLSCDHRGVRIGIEAPAQIGIVREEIAGQAADPERGAASVVAARAWLSRRRRTAPGQDTESSRTS